MLVFDGAPHSKVIGHNGIEFRISSFADDPCLKVFKLGDFIKESDGIYQGNVMIDVYIKNEQIIAIQNRYLEPYPTGVDIVFKHLFKYGPQRRYGRGLNSWT